MNAEGHNIITQAAMQALPEWQRELWQSEISNLAQTYSLYGDDYWIDKKNIGPFFELPDGTVPACAIGVLRDKKHYAQAVDFWESPFYDRCICLFKYFMGQIAENIRKGDILSAAKFAGSAAHYLEDSGAPPHAADNGDIEFVKDCLEIPEKFKAFPLHALMELSPAPFLIDGYQPRLYGLTLDEAAGNFIERYIELVLHARKFILPMAECVFKEDHARASELSRLAAVKTAEVFADYVYTAACMGTGRFEHGETERLNEVSLAGKWPYRMSAWCPFPYLEPAPLMLKGINLDQDRKPVPCRLLVSPNGSAEIRTFPDALGAGLGMEYHFKIPAGVYSDFSVYPGIHAELGARKPVNIRIVFDEKTVYETTLSPTGAAHKINLELKNVSGIKLIAPPPRDNDLWYADPASANNHIVWAEPHLKKLFPKGAEKSVKH